MMSLAHLAPSLDRRPHEATFRRELSLPRGNIFRRAITARARAALTGKSPGAIAEVLWPNDRVTTEWLMRSASVPAMTTVAGWAAELAHLVVMDALEALGPASAGARVLRGSTVLVFDGAGIISAPGFVASAANAGFVAEGAPIPVRQLSDSAVQMGPHKMAAIAVLTEEMVLSSNAETLIGDALIRSAAAALDVVLFDANPGTAVRPAGLRNGVAALTASNNADAWSAYFEDASALINSVSAVGGAGPFILIANPGRAVEMRLRAMGDQGNPYSIYASNEIGNDLMAIAPQAIVAAIAPEPEIEISGATSLHMNDAPLAIVNGGTPAAPAKSMFQTASVALKMRWPVTWALRDSRGVAWLTPAWK
jgi:hypothetical protein